MIVIFSGLPGSGKSLKLARTVVDILYRNRAWYEKTGQKRMLWSNLKMSEGVEKEFEGYIEYWIDLEQLVPLRDVDVVIDEVATYFDARLWTELSIDMRRWLNQHRKFGLEIYGTAQDFAQVDKAFRRLTSDLLYLTKLFGSADISATRPAPKFIWGCFAIRHLDPVQYKEDTDKFASSGIPSFGFITRSATEIFNTRAEVAFSKSLVFRHVQKHCLTCGFVKSIHV